MQKFIVKYGLAAHLTVLAVAPLFLYFVCPASAAAIALLWLAIPAALWSFLEPSIRRGELLREARRRVLVTAFEDPLVWALLALVAAVGISAVNSGVALAYDAENSTWLVSKATSSILPGSVEGCGFFLFASLLATWVVVLGVRHSLGRSARTWFMLGSSSLAGVLAVVGLTLSHLGYLDLAGTIRVDEAAYSFVGLTYGFFLLVGTAALVGALENEWHAAIPVFFVGIGGTMAGVFCFCPVYLLLAIAVAEVLLVVYAIIFVRLTLQATGQLKILGSVLFALVLGGLAVAALLPQSSLTPKLEAIQAFLLFPEDFWASRQALSAVAMKSWFLHPWIGTGLGSFSIDFRFAATAADWTSLPRGVAALPNGWWLLLAERGVLGVVLFVLPLGALVYTYGVRFVGWCRAVELPHPSCLIAVLAVPLAIAALFFDCSVLRADAVMALFPAVVVSALSFPVVRKVGHGG